VVATRFLEYSRLTYVPGCFSNWVTQFYFYQEKIYKNRVITQIKNLCIMNKFPIELIANTELLTEI